MQTWNIRAFYPVAFVYHADENPCVRTLIIIRWQGTSNLSNSLVFFGTFSLQIAKRVFNIIYIWILRTHPISCVCECVCRHIQFLLLCAIDSEIERKIRFRFLIAIEFLLTSFFIPKCVSMPSSTIIVINGFEIFTVAVGMRLRYQANDGIQTKIRFSICVTAVFYCPFRRAKSRSDRILWPDNANHVKSLIETVRWRWEKICALRMKRRCRTEAKGMQWIYVCKCGSHTML